VARLAGLALRERWADWNRTPFTSDSRNHISVWEKPPSPRHRGARDEQDSHVLGTGNS
jgi:hypothetical protein